VAKFQYLGRTVTKRNCIHEEIEIKEQIKFGECLLLFSLLSSHLLSKKLNIKIYRIITLPVVSYGRGTWSLTVREEHRLRVFENRVLKGICGPGREEVGEV
jgi:hypothetical protein